MNREIKFRVWTDENKMVGPFDLSQNPKSWIGLQDGERMLFAGIRDINGIEIYEGDIVKGKVYKNGKEHRHIGEVKMVTTSFKAVGINNYFGCNEELHPLYEVIGNIYESTYLINRK